jgi:C4-dicarboxylate-specific signal transduction histidine kinase
VLTVSDSGIGIPTDLYERIFEPFFTTKTKGSGHGLGLSISHQIVLDYRGYFQIESLQDTGTTVQIVFPI